MAISFRPYHILSPLVFGLLGKYFGTLVSTFLAFSFRPSNPDPGRLFCQYPAFLTKIIFSYFFSPGHEIVQLFIAGRPCWSWGRFCLRIFWQSDAGIIFRHVCQARPVVLGELDLVRRRVLVALLIRIQLAQKCTTPSILEAN